MTKQELLERANAHRSMRAAWKREVRGMPRAAALDRVAALLIACPVWARSWPVADVFMALPRVGPGKISAAMRGFCRVVRVGDITPGEREVIVAFLRAERDAAEGRYQRGRAA